MTSPSQEPCRPGPGPGSGAGPEAESPGPSSSLNDDLRCETRKEQTHEQASFRPCNECRRRKQKVRPLMLWMNFARAIPKILGVES